MIRKLLPTLLTLGVLGALLAVGWWFARDTDWWQDLVGGDDAGEEVPSDLTDVFETAVVTRSDVADIGELDARLVYQNEVELAHRVDPTETTVTQTIGQGRFAQRVSTTVEEPGTRAITGLPEPGERILPGEVLMETDSTPVYLVAGEVAAHRTMDTDTDGADIAQLQQYLVDGGWAEGLDVVADGEWTSATTNAVEAWQDDTGQTVTGTVELGDLWFSPGPIRIVDVHVTEGVVVTDAEPVLTYTSDERAVEISVAELPDGLLEADDFTIDLPGVGDVPGELVSSRGTELGFDLVFSVDLEGRDVGSVDRLPVAVEWTIAELDDELTIPPEAIRRLDSGVYVVDVLDGDTIRRTEVEVIGQAGRVVAITGLPERTRVLIP